MFIFPKKKKKKRKHKHPIRGRVTEMWTVSLDIFKGSDG